MPSAAAVIRDLLGVGCDQRPYGPVAPSLGGYHRRRSWPLDEKGFAKIGSALVQIGGSGSLRSGFEERERAMSNLVNIDRLFNGRHFDSEFIVLCAHRYLHYKLSFLDLVELIGERGVSLAHAPILRWVKRFTPQFVKHWDRFAKSASRSQRVDETYGKVRC